MNNGQCNIIKENSQSDENINVKKTISDSKLMNLYKEKLQSSIPENIVDTQVSYALVDINKDNIPELIIKTGTCEADYRYYFYTYNENNSYYDFDNYVVYAGFIDAGYSGLYKMNNDNYLVYVYAHMGAETISYLTLENDWIVDKRISQRVNVEDYKTGDESISLVDYKDTSLFDNYK